MPGLCPNLTATSTTAIRYSSTRLAGASTPRNISASIVASTHANTAQPKSMKRSHVLLTFGEGGAINAGAVMFLSMPVSAAKPRCNQCGGLNSA